MSYLISVSGLKNSNLADAIFIVVKSNQIFGSRIADGATLRCLAAGLCRARTLLSEYCTHLPYKDAQKKRNVTCFDDTLEDYLLGADNGRDG